MVSGWVPFKIDLSNTMLKGDHPRTIPAKFVLIWFSGFRGEDLNVIFYQNMPNLHNRYYANWAYFDKKSHLNLLL
jgi:hypothetical protein